MVVGGVEQLDADVGQQLLVGGDDRLAGGQRRGDQLAGRLDAADDLDDEVDVRIGDDVVGVAGEHAGRQVDVAVAGEVAHGDPGDLEARRRCGPRSPWPGRRSARRTPRRRCRSRGRRCGRAGVPRSAGYGAGAGAAQPVPSRPPSQVPFVGMSGSGMASPKLMPMSRAVSIVSQSSGTIFSRLVASAERHVAHGRRVERHHHAVVALLQRPHRGGAEAQAEQAVERRRRAAPQQVAEHDGAGLLAGEPLEALGDDLARCRRASRPARWPCRAPTPRRRPAPRPRRRRRSRTWRRGRSRWAIVAATGSSVERDLRDQDGVGARRRARRTARSTRRSGPSPRRR